MQIVQIRDFPSRIYSSHFAQNYMDHMTKPQFFAEKRLAELGLAWQIKGGAIVPDVGFVFTI